MKRGIPMELRPTQRFPEFIGQKLHDVRLGEVTEESTARNGSRLPPASVMGVRKEDGIVQMEGRLVAADISRYKLVGSNWFAYNPMRLNIGSIARWQGDSVVLVSPDYVVFRCLEQSTPAALHPEYLDHFRRSSQWDAFVNEAGDGGVRVRIYYRDISQLRLIVPDVVEQQKIADCLGSLDDLIAAEGRKLEALRRHKQGLMQQLFPQPGETVPRLRFPEFRNAPDWKTGRCRDIAKVLPGYGFPDKFQGNKKGQYPFYKVSDISHTIEKGQRYISEANNSIDSDVLDKIRGKSVPAGTIIFAKIGEAIRSNRRVITTKPAVIDNNTAGVKAMNGKSSDEFLFYLWSNVSLIDHAGGVVPAVRKSALENVPLCYPSDPAEQQRIADCLSAVSTRIGAQMGKLDTLRTHKQGLMQQLFPSLEGH